MPTMDIQKQSPAIFPSLRLHYILEWDIFPCLFISNIQVTLQVATGAQKHKIKFGVKRGSQKSMKLVKERRGKSSRTVLATSNPPKSHLPAFTLSCPTGWSIRILHFNTWGLHYCAKRPQTKSFLFPCVKPCWTTLLTSSSSRFMMALLNALMSRVLNFIQGYKLLYFSRWLQLLHSVSFIRATVKKD